MVRKTTSILLAHCILIANLYAQSSEVLLQEALHYESNFKSKEALQRYEEIINSNPDHILALVHASRILSVLGGHLQKEKRDEKLTYFNKSETYAKQAITLEPTSKEARLAHIIALGMKSEISRNPHEKVSDAQLIYNEARAILKIDSLFPEAYFVLGKWQLELSRLNWFELLACKILGGGLPEEISTEAALRYFTKAVTLRSESILFLFGQASAYSDLGENNRARAILERALRLPVSEPDDYLRKERCKELLEKIKT